MAIRIGSLDPQANLIARRLADHHRVLCASADYLERRGIPQHASDLASHDCLQFTFTDNRRSWRLRRRDGNPEGLVEEIRVNSIVQANSGEVLRQAAIAGLGIAMLSDWLVRDDLRKGRLVRVLEQYDVNPGPMDVALYALYQANRRGSQKIRAFVELLSEHLAMPDTTYTPSRATAERLNSSPTQ